MLLLGLPARSRSPLVSIVLGVIVGLIVALMRMAANPWLRKPATAFVEFYRNTPPIVHFFWFFYALPIVIGVSLDPFVAASARVVDAVRARSTPRCFAAASSRSSAASGRVPRRSA